VDKGTGLQTAADRLGRDPSSFVAVGDSENDAEAFELVGTGIAVANADPTAKAAADRVTDGSYADGFLEAVEAVRNR
jgi:hydroxymethylpyrimidine pyrophosphatase-like HAD family hydrolase